MTIIMNKGLKVFLYAVIAVFTSAGSLNFGYVCKAGFYTVMGLLMLGITAYEVYRAVKSSGGKRDEK